jgi:hypothetical protein
MGIGHGRAEVRLIAAALLLNMANAIPPGDGSEGVSHAEGDATVTITDTGVAVLCACLDGVDTEQDKEVTRRRLTAAGRVLVRQGHEACALAETLGYATPVRAVALDGSGGREGALRGLAAEVLALITAPHE